MAILDFLKKKKKVEEKEEKPKKIKKKKEEKKEAKKPPTLKVKKKKKIKKKIPDFVFQVLKEPHITEKATDLTKKNQYTFKVLKDANKNQIKTAVETLYGVDVISVNIINIPRKKRRLGRIEGFKKAYKKAIVKIKEGQKIEIMPK